MSTAQLVDRLVGNPDHIEMDYRPAVGVGDHVDDAREERLDGIARDDERTWPHSFRFVRLVAACPVPPAPGR